MSNFKMFYQNPTKIILSILVLMSFNSYGQNSEPTASETAEWINFMLDNRCATNEDFGHLEACIQTTLLTAKELNIGLSNLLMSYGRTVIKDVYRVNFSLLDPENIEVTSTKIILKATNGNKVIEKTRYIFNSNDFGLKEIVQLDNVNLIEIQINGENMKQLLDKAEWIDISRVQKSFENIIRKNGGIKSTIEWKSDKQLKQEKIKEIKKRF